MALDTTLKGYTSGNTVEADSSKIWGSPRSQLSQSYPLPVGAQAVVKDIPMNLADGNRVTISYSISYSNSPFYRGTSAVRTVTLQ